MEMFYFNVVVVAWLLLMWIMVLKRGVGFLDRFDATCIILIAILGSASDAVTEYNEHKSHIEEDVK